MASPAHSEKITIAGAGLVGALLAIGLGRRGFAVEVFERRPDMRKEKISAGRSINLAISTRGINALAALGLDKEILKHAVPMKGRMIHALDGTLSFQPYGVDESQFINSISRATLNKMLMDFAEGTNNVTMHFKKKVQGIDLSTNVLELFDEETQTSISHQANIVIGTDGAASAIRQEMVKLPGYQCHESLLDYGYKELVINPDAAGGFKLERNALHIWPRKTFMLIALPNFEGSFTCTLFLPFEGPLSFANLTTPEEVAKFFADQFPDAVPLISDLVDTFFANPTGHMVTVKCNPWNVNGQALLMGDAAHGIVPFFGQGMNCGFEDCTVFGELLDQAIKEPAFDWKALFDKFVSLRRVNSDAIADMAVENFVEMRDKVADPQFQLQKQVEQILQKRFPGRYISRYALVTFSLVPYRIAYEAGLVEDEILRELCDGLTDAQHVDLEKAEMLIREKLVPVFAHKEVPVEFS